MTSPRSKMAPLSFWLMMLSLMLFSSPASAVDTATSTVSTIFHSTDELHWSTAILAVVAIGAGIVVCVAGYRLFRCAIFFCGFIVGGLAVATVIEYVFSDKSWIVTGSWVGFLVGGVFVGIFAMSLYKTSVFIAGAAAGVLLAFTVQTTVTYRISPEHPDTVLVVLAVVLGLIGGLLAMRMERPLLIVATSFAGAVVTVWGIGQFAGDFPNAADLEAYRHQTVNTKWVYSIPHAWWAYLAGIIVIFVLGLMFQFKKTSRGYTYNKPSSQSHAIGNDDYDYEANGTPQQPQERPRTNNPISYV